MSVLKRFSKSFFIIGLLLAGVLSSCYDNSDCANAYSDIIHIEFLSVNENGTADPDTLGILEVRALGIDSVLYKKGNSAANPVMSFRVNPTTSATTYIFIQKEAIDTLVAIYDVKPILINPDCGLTYIINLDTAFTSLDSVKIINKGLRYQSQDDNNSQNNINLEVYF